MAPKGTIVVGAGARTTEAAGIIGTATGGAPGAAYCDGRTGTVAAAAGRAGPMDIAWTCCCSDFMYWMVWSSVEAWLD
jgi:hypothetical protein